MKNKLIHILVIPSLFLNISACANTNKESTCYGNIETFDKHIVKPGVSYKLFYTIHDSQAQVSFAGNEFLAKVEKGISWKGIWIKRFDDKVYFSYLPDDGGIIKFQFEPNLWFSGNC